MRPLRGFRLPRPVAAEHDSSFRAGLPLEGAELTRIPRIVVADLRRPAASGVHGLRVRDPRPAVLADRHVVRIVEADVDMRMAG